VVIDGKRVLGVVHDTSHARVYAGIVGAGAQCDSRLISVSSVSELSRTLVGTGFFPTRQCGKLRERSLGEPYPWSGMCAAVAALRSTSARSLQARWTGSMSLGSVAGTSRLVRQSPRLQEPPWSSSIPSSSRIRCWWSRTQSSLRHSSPCWSGPGRPRTPVRAPPNMRIGTMEARVAGRLRITPSAARSRPCAAGQNPSGTARTVLESRGHSPSGGGPFSAKKGWHPLLM
jgi:hypothetical protein